VRAYLIAALALAAFEIIPSAPTDVQPVTLRATYTLPARSDAQFGACTITADASRAVMGIPWGGGSPQGPSPYDSMCRGFRLITLPSGRSRTIVLLPAAQKAGLWAVDEPVLVGGWLAYAHYVGIVNGRWEVVLVNLRTLQQRTLARRSPGIAVDVPPLLYGWGQRLIWTAGEIDRRGRIVSRVRAYDVRTGHQQVLSASPPHAPGWTAHTVRFINARVSGSLMTFLRQTAAGSDVWVEDRRTRHLRALTRTGRASEAVVTGPWVAWHELGKNAVGPVMVADVRTGAVRTVSTAPSYYLSAGNGLLIWDDFWKSQCTVLDLATGHRWQVPRLSPTQITGTSAQVIGSAIVETAIDNSSIGNITARNVYLARVLVYATRRLPAVPAF
jgi:hypothetical protein